ncbi:MAG: DNA repair protein RecN [Propionibacteriaceae bacterium]|nr:DNA repair protein RecN [Propionibacteriaceae bacterium]
MLTELRITDLGVIDRAALEPDRGLTVVSGETGAGKTLVVTGLGLVAGWRSEAGVIRQGRPKAQVEARFAELGSKTLALVGESAGELDDDGELLVVRQVAPGRSRSWIGGTGVPGQAAARLGAELVTIHGQSEQVRLGSPQRQREILDRAAGAEQASLLERYQGLYETRRRLRAELDQLTDQTQRRAQEADLLRFGLEEIARVDPQPGEDVALAAEALRLGEADDLKAAVFQAVLALAGDDDDPAAGSALSGLALARRALAQAAARDPLASPLADQVSQILALTGDLAGSASAYLADLEVDPIRGEQIAARLASLQALTRKYGPELDQVIAWAAQAGPRLAELDGSDERMTDLAAQLERLEAELEDLAEALSERRRATAGQLARRVEAELQALALPQARLEFTLQPADQLGPWGRDQVALMFSANPGSAPAPLAKVASGGELSRVRLGLEVVLAGVEDDTTLVFDEVDAGVGGAVGVEIGRRLAALARHSQVIVVTHLAQVAAFADRHYLVSKSAADGRTSAEVRQLDEEERLTELARMMGGLELTASSRAHAAELLAVARRAAVASA